MSASLEQITPAPRSAKPRQYPKPRHAELPRALPGDPLIKEEMDLLLLLAKGFTAMDVISITGARKRRVYLIRERIFAKADCSSEVELGIWAHRQGLV